MHSTNLESSHHQQHQSVGDVLVALSALITEGRIPGKTSASKNRGFYEGPHCCTVLSNSQIQHTCSDNDVLCRKYDQIRGDVLNLWQKRIPLCIDVLLSTVCPVCPRPCDDDNTNSGGEEVSRDILLEKWCFTILVNRASDITVFNVKQLINAIRSQLYFSQISAWLSCQEKEDANGSLKLSANNLKYNLTIPGETFERCDFSNTAIKHVFPLTEISCGLQLKVTLMSLPRMSPPVINCPQCSPPEPTPASSTLTTTPNRPLEDMSDEVYLLDDRMHLNCTLKGKHRCDDVDEFELRKERVGHFKRVCCYGEASTSSSKLRLEQPKPMPSSSTINSSEKRISTNGQDHAAKTPKLDFKSNADLKRQHESCSSSSSGGGSISGRSDVFLQAILRSCKLQDESIRDESSGLSDCGQTPTASTPLAIKCDVKCVQRLGEIGTSILNGCAKALQSVSDIHSDKHPHKRDIDSSCKNKLNIYEDDECDTVEPRGLVVADKPGGKRQLKKIRDISNLQLQGLADNQSQLNTNQNEQQAANEKSKTESNIIEIPSPNAKAKFRKSLDNAANMVFHARTGLPLTSSPAPVRRGKFRFDFDSSINTVSDIRSALFSTSISTDDDSESDGSIVSPCSPDASVPPKKQPSPVKQYRRSNAANLLGSFEESVLNGRLEPVSTVHGFTAELGASGSFVPRHLFVPVTVFFYTLGDNDKISSPYLGHINLGKKGYLVPNQGTVQVTLFNPLGTVVKMFVIMYDLSDMPPNSQTFIRQRTLYMPTKRQEQGAEEWGPKWLRYLVHLRFLSSKSGRTYLHSDVRMIIFRKSDMDTATAHGIDLCYELRSFTHMPSNPKYSPRK